MLVLLSTNFFTEHGLSLEKSVIARLNVAEDRIFIYCSYKLAVNC